jgi:hypothetical protein
MKETAAVPSPSSKKSPIGKGLLMVPKTAGVLKHRRAGSTGTTGDESYTTDEEDNVEIDEPDLHVPTKLFNHDSSDFGSFSDIATITDKVMHRNSSDSSVYSDLGLEKLEKGEDQGDWARQVVGAKEQTFARLQDELRDAHQELKLKDEEVARLSRIRQDVEAELEDLTASLFQVNSDRTMRPTTRTGRSPPRLCRAEERGGRVLCRLLFTTFARSARLSPRGFKETRIRESRRRIFRLKMW